MFHSLLFSILYFKNTPGSLSGTHAWSEPSPKSSEACVWLNIPAAPGKCTICRTVRYVQEPVVLIVCLLASCARREDLRAWHLHDGSFLRSHRWTVVYWHRISRAHVAREGKKRRQHHQFPFGASGSKADTTDQINHYWWKAFIVPGL